MQSEGGAPPLPPTQRHIRVAGASTHCERAAKSTRQRPCSLCEWFQPSPSRCWQQVVGTWLPRVFMNKCMCLHASAHGTLCHHPHGMHLLAGTHQFLRFSKEALQRNDFCLLAHCEEFLMISEGNRVRGRNISLCV